MRSEVSDKVVDEFPCLYIVDAGYSVAHGVIALMGSESHGTVIYVPPKCDRYELGEHINSWFRPDEFVKYNGAVILTN